MKVYHLHINGLELTPNTLLTLQAEGFEYKPSQIFLAGIGSPFHLFTAQTKDITKKEIYWNRALEIMQADGSFEGYIEDETNPQLYFSNNRPFRFLPFPQLSYDLVDVKKRADVHVYRDVTLERDTLDEVLLAHHFYEVHTSKSRIFTAETATPREALRLFNILKEYFNQTGGIKNLEFEVVNRLVRVPDTFPLRKVIRLI